MIRVEINRTIVKEFIDDLISTISQKEFDVERDFIFIERAKNNQTLIEFEFDIWDVLEHLKQLTVEDFSEVIMDFDDPDPPYLFVFGKTILDRLVYIKLKIRKLEHGKIVVCISFHIAERAMDFPFVQ